MREKGSLFSSSRDFSHFHGFVTLTSLSVSFSQVFYISLWTNLYSTLRLSSLGRYWGAGVLVTLVALAVTVLVILVIDRHQRKVRGGSWCGNVERGEQDSSCWVIPQLQAKNATIQGGRSIFRALREGRGCSAAKGGDGMLEVEV